MATYLYVGLGDISVVHLDLLSMPTSKYVKLQEKTEALFFENCYKLAYLRRVKSLRKNILLFKVCEYNVTHP